MDELNTKDNILQAMEEGLEQVEDLLCRMLHLASAASEGGGEELDGEFQFLKDELREYMDTAEYNELYLFKPTVLGSYTPEEEAPESL